MPQHTIGCAAAYEALWMMVTKTGAWAAFWTGEAAASLDALRQGSRKDIRHRRHMGHVQGKQRTRLATTGFETLQHGPTILPDKMPSPRRSLSSQGSVLIVFDWDDTLMCTTFLTAYKEQRHLPYVEQCIRRTASLARQILEQSLRVGRTFIVTNADAGWVEFSAKKWMPELLPLFAKSRDEANKVQIISARSRHESAFPGQDRMWKQRAFMDLQHELGKGDIEARQVTDLISIGDSEGEMIAARVAAAEAFPGSRAKTVKFSSAPSPLELATQLRCVDWLFNAIVDGEQDAHVLLEIDRVRNGVGAPTHTLQARSTDLKLAEHAARAASYVKPPPAGMSPEPTPVLLEMLSLPPRRDGPTAPSAPGPVAGVAPENTASSSSEAPEESPAPPQCPARADQPSSVQLASSHSPAPLAVCGRERKLEVGSDVSVMERLLLEASKRRQIQPRPRSRILGACGPRHGGIFGAMGLGLEATALAN